MAGLKGRSGGPRPNSGGARPGSGPKRKAPEQIAEIQPLEFLLRVMRGEIDANAAQIKAATVAAQYVHTRKSDGGKKDEKGEAAKKAGSGRFAPAPGPRLATANGKPVGA